MLDTDFYLFLYDIHEPKTMRKIVKRLDQENSMRIQKSVFEVQGDKREILNLLDDVKKIIDTETDKVAVIPLCADDYSKVTFYGKLSRRPVELPKAIIL